jgi:NADPH:quinone reductase-like Zn-dependent oxidoreductase
MHLSLDRGREHWTLPACDDTTSLDSPDDMRQESATRPKGAYVVVIGGSRGIGLSTARLARNEGAEVTMASRSQEKRIKAQQGLGQVHTAMMDITDDAGNVEKGMVGPAVSIMGPSRPGRFATARWLP